MSSTDLKDGATDPRVLPSVENKPKAADRAKAAHENAQPTVSEPGGFANDPDEPTNPNEAIERHRRTLRP